MSNFLKEVNGVPRGTAMVLGDLPSIGSDTILGNNTGGSTTPSALTVSQVNTLLGTITSISVVSSNGFAGSASGGSITLSTTITGVLKGNGTSISAATAGTDYVIPSGSITGTSSNITGTSNSTLTTLSALTTASSLSSVGTITSGTWTGTAIAIANGGTGQTSASAAYNALSPMTTTGDIEYEVSNGTAARLGIGTTGQVLTVVSGKPAWAAASSGPTYRAGTQTVSNGTTSQTITFSSTIGSTNYAPSVVMVNTTDSNPQFQPLTITALSATGFTVSWNAPTASSNYSIAYTAIGNN